MFLKSFSLLLFYCNIHFQVNLLRIYWAEASKVSGNAENSESMSCALEWMEPAARYRKIQREILKSSESPESHSMCEYLEHSGYSELLKDVLAVFLLSAKLESIRPILGIIAESSSSGVYFSYFATLGPRTLRHLLSFLLDQFCEGQERFTDAASIQWEMRKRKNTALLASIASKDSVTGAVLDAIIDRVASAGKSFSAAAEIFTLILRKGVEYSGVSVFVEKAVFEVDEYSTAVEFHGSNSGTATPYSSLLYKTSGITSSWLLSGVSVDNLKYFSDCAIRTIEDIIKGDSCLHADGEAAVKLQCRVLVAICCGLRMGNTESIALLGSMHQRCLEWDSYVPVNASAESRCAVLRLQISLMGYIIALPISDRLDESVSLLLSLSAVLLRHLECCERGGVVRDKWFSFFIRAALALRDGESFCRILLEEIGCGVTASWAAARAASSAAVCLSVGKCGSVAAAMQQSGGGSGRTDTVIQEQEIFPQVCTLYFSWLNILIDMFVFPPVLPSSRINVFAGRISPLLRGGRDVGFRASTNSQFSCN
jgi:hypothetical protein